jgi:uncharacterized membrane protein YhiD involved in acid resistance
MDDFLTVFGTGQWLGAEQVLVSLLMAFMLSSVLATVYRWTFTSLSYSRSFIHTMILGSMAVAMMIMIVGNSLARGLGILGSLAIVRYRSPIRDPRDMTFLFACFAVGVGCGSSAYAVVIMGTFVLSSAVLLLHWSPFASRRHHEALLRFMLPPQSSSEEKVKEIMRMNCSAFSLVAMREASQGELIEYCYHVRLIDPSYREDLVARLTGVQDLSEPNLLLQRTTVEL